MLPEKDMQRFFLVPAFLTIFAMTSQTSSQKMDTWRELVFPAGSLKDSVLVIQDERAGVLTDPLRWRILEILQDGKSVTQISRTLGVTDARVLYHLRRLAETGVVRLQEDEGDSPEWRCVPAAGKVRVREPLPGDDQPAEAIPAEVASQFIQSGISRSCGGLVRSGISDVSQPQPGTTVRRTSSRIRPAVTGPHRRILSPRERGSIGHQVRFPRGSHAD